MERILETVVYDPKDYPVVFEKEGVYVIRNIPVVKVSTSTAMPLIRQTRGGSGIFGCVQFIENKPIGRCDYWVVYDDVLDVETVVCPRDNTILITGEPPCIKTYNPDFSKQFAMVITPHRNLKHPNIINYHPCLPWHIGRKILDSGESEYPSNFDELSAISQFDKSRLISVIVSNKTKTRDQRQRLKFIEQFKKRSGFELEIFGNGMNHIDDKWNAIAPYKYHLVLENCAVPDYFSEKLSDSYLGGAYPFYYGCTNLDRYFSEDAYTPIDIYDADESFEIIEKSINTNIYEASTGAIAEARNLVLMKYNFFAVIASWVNRHEQTKTKQTDELVTIYPQYFFDEKTLFGKIKGVVKRTGVLK